MSTVLYESKNGVSYVYMNRPERYNAMNKEMLTELLDVLSEVEQNEDRIVVLSGKGKAFSAGGDIGMMADLADKSFYEEVMQTIGDIALKLYMMPKMVISAVHGSAAGLGLSLALTADYVVAQQEAKLGMRNNLYGEESKFRALKRKQWGLSMYWQKRMFWSKLS